MTLNNNIINLLKQKSGLLFDKAGDFELLSSSVFSETGRTIGVTTLKRLFNYINDDRKASDYTLNTIALYLGYGDWEQLVHSININSAWGYDDEGTIYIQSLEAGTRLEVSYLNRKVLFVVTKRNGENVLKVVSAENSSLMIGDECDIYKISKGSFLEARHVYRGESIGNYKTRGEVSSINLHQIENANSQLYNDKLHVFGAIIGDIIGSRWEFDSTNDYDFEWLSNENGFTDDTICTIAVADALLKGRDFGVSIHDWCNRYPNPMGGYGGRFAQWVHSNNPQPYNSYGNGAAMRVSPVAHWYKNLDEVLESAAATARPSHNHAEGIKGAQTIALATFRALQLNRQQPKSAPQHIKEILSECVEFSGYDINIKETAVMNRFDETCQGTVPVALWVIGNSNSFEDAIRRAICLGADADTLGAIVGSIAEAIWGIPDNIKKTILRFIPDEMKQVIVQFYEQVDKE